MLKNQLPKKFSQVISNFLDNVVIDSSNFVDSFVLNRMKKKWQEPREDIEALLKANCWATWSKYDQDVIFPLNREHTVFQSDPSFWYRVKQSLRNLRVGDHAGGLSFSVGSSFTQTKGLNSIEEKLQNSPWDITHSCFEEFIKVILQNRCLAFCLKRRFFNLFKARGEAFIYFPTSWHMSPKEMCLRDFHSEKFFRDVCGGDVTNVYRIMLQNVAEFQLGSRFSSVPKNNEVRRPINIEPLCNMIVQKCIGKRFRDFLEREFNVDLDTLADNHRVKISDPQVSTIDLKNASDSISIGLCHFLLPPSVFKLLLKARSSYIEHEGDWHKVNKISAMGNGFTFELMSTLLTAIGRQLDPNCTVFGDDIIIHQEHAVSMIQKIEEIGFQVNSDKSFISGPFRESCGGNYHDHFGYIKSFDFNWPVVDHDCVVLFNKVAALPNSFLRPLEQQLRRFIPIAMRGPKDDFNALSYLGAHTTFDQVTNPLLSGYFRSEVDLELHEPNPVLKTCLDVLHLGRSVYIFTGWASKVEEANRQVNNINMSIHHGKYFMYLYSGRRCKNVISWSTSWTHCALVYVGGRVFRLSHLLQQQRKLN